MFSSAIATPLGEHARADRNQARAARTIVVRIVGLFLGSVGDDLDGL
jgi:hypothetical protein